MEISSYLDLVSIIKDAEVVAKAFNIKPFPIYFLGGSACILGGYTDRATLDIDFIDIEYASHMGKVFSIFKDYDMLEYESTILSPKYKDRAIRIHEFNYLEVYVLSREDIIVSKIVCMRKKDIEDIDMLMKSADKNLILKIIDEVMARTDLYDTKKSAFIKNIPKFKERYYV